MADKVLNTRVQQKHDIEANWLKATNFIPKIGEVIVYDPDETHAAARVKIGDGERTVGQLPFISGQADWNVNDESSAAYVKNRTHWEAEDGTIHQLDPKFIPTASEEQLIQLLLDIDALPAMTDSNGAIFTHKDSILLI